MVESILLRQIFEKRPACEWGVFFALIVER